jgi:hypothetical protein
VIRIIGRPSTEYRFQVMFGAVCFAFSSCSRYFVFSWMSKLYERRTVVANIQDRRYFILPEYIYKFTVMWPTVVGDGEVSDDQQYIFTGSEQWLSY